MENRINIRQAAAAAAAAPPNILTELVMLRKDLLLAIIPTRLSLLQL